MGHFCRFIEPPRYSSTPGRALPLRYKLPTSVLLLLALIVGFLPAASPIHAETWSEVVAAAKREGEVSVMGAPGQSYGEALKAFNKVYPEIKLNFIGMLGRNALPRLLRERQVYDGRLHQRVLDDPIGVQATRHVGATAASLARSRSH